MLHESGMRRLLECALPTAPPLMLPLECVLLHKGAHRHVHKLVEQLVLLAAPAVVARNVPLCLDVVLVLGDGGAAGHLDRLARLCSGLGAQQPVGPAAELLAVGGIGGIELVWLDLCLCLGSISKQ